MDHTTRMIELLGRIRKQMNGAVAEVVHSLAKWKRVTLAEYNIAQGYGIYTDMNAIRAHEELDNLHSLYVDQWDWERTITAEQRTVEYLKQIVTRIYSAMRRTEYMVCEMYPQIKPFLPKGIHFIHAEELMQKYPDLTPKDREHAITKEYGAVFIIGIGCELSNGQKHDNRAPDYDDWQLNGDILVYYPLLDIGLELSSMGIRVDEKALDYQLTVSGHNDRRQLPFHKMLLAGELPLTIGGGIGQSRLCMLYLKKAHIGEIQSSIWPTEMRAQCTAINIPLI